MVSEKVARVGVRKESGWLYFVDKDGDVSRARMARGRGTGSTYHQSLVPLFQPFNSKTLGCMEIIKLPFSLTPLFLN